MQEVYLPLLPVGLVWRSLDQGGCESTGTVEGMPEQLRAAQSQSELALVPGAE